MRAQLQVFEDLAARARRAEDIERERKLQKAMDELAARPRRTD
jgi:flagellar biosynthesis chaperone FliJ